MDKGALAEKERQEMEHLSKLMTMKSAQVIVQSRMGEKLHTYCSDQNSLVSDMYPLLIPNKSILNIYTVCVT